MNNYCPLGLECVTDESVSFHRRNYCANLHTCYTWTKEWELPYRCDYNRCCDYNRLIVSFLENYNNLQDDLSENQITSQYDWRKYFAEYGFAEAVDLPYYFRENGVMMVCIDNDSVCREEIHKAGYANATVLPLQRRKEFYSADTYEGFSYQEVDLFYCGDEAINALNAGYADAIWLLPVSLNEQRCFNN
jgi:hypothetical protein